jgi:chromosomal replication initiation ATPase DnaA
MKPNYQILTERAAAIYKVSLAELLGPSKERRLSWARFAIWAALYDMRGPNQMSAYSTTMIGRVFGRDHSTIISGIRRAKELGLQLPQLDLERAPHIAGATEALMFAA